MVEPSKTSSQNAPELITITREEYDKLRYDNLFLHQELEKLKRMIFGTKSERFSPSDPSQLSMELGQCVPATVEPQTEDINYTRQKASKKDGHARMQISPSIPREIVVIEPAEDVTDGRKIGEKVTEVLDYTPGKLTVTRYVRQA